MNPRIRRIYCIGFLSFSASIFCVVSYVLKTNASESSQDKRAIIKGKIYGYDDGVINPLDGVKVTVIRGDDTLVNRNSVTSSFSLPIRDGQPVLMFFEHERYATSRIFCARGDIENTDTVVVTLINARNAQGLYGDNINKFFNKLEDKDIPKKREN